MRYTIKRDDRELAFDVDRENPGRLRVVRDDQTLTVDVCHLPDGDVHLLVEGRSYDVSVALDGPDARCVIDGQTRDLQVFNERQLRLLRLEEASQGSFIAEVLSPMAGKVIAVEVAPGDTVDEHSALVVIEAMKMENIIRPEQPGRVESLAVEVGQAVEPGQTLVVLAPLETDDVAAGPD